MKRRHIGSLALITAASYVLGGLVVSIRKILLEIRRREIARSPQTTAEVLPAEVAPRAEKPEAPPQKTAEVTYRSNLPMRGLAEWMGH